MGMVEAKAAKARWFSSRFGLSALFTAAAFGKSVNNQVDQLETKEQRLHDEIKKVSSLVVAYSGGYGIYWLPLDKYLVGGLVPHLQ
jgi:hypothetical protein